MRHVEVHYGRAESLQQRALVLDAAYAAYPERFVRKSAPPRLPTVAWINEPNEVTTTTH